MFSKSFKKSAALIGLLYLSALGTAIAGSQTGKIVFLHVRSTDGLIIVDMNGPVTNRAACASYPYWLVEDEKSNAGKQQLAMLMAAHLAGKTISLNGTGTCSRWPDGETIGTVTVHPD
jgi:hypothetical protein